MPGGVGSVNDGHRDAERGPGRRVEAPGAAHGVTVEQLAAEVLPTVDAMPVVRVLSTVEVMPAGEVTPGVDADVAAFVSGTVTGPDAILQRLAET